MSGSRRQFLGQLAGTLGLGAFGVTSSAWFPAFANQLSADPQRRRHCILLWMAGGASQTDTFDMKPGHRNGGEFKEIETNVPGLRFSEHLPGLATQADKLAIIRSLSTKEGDHGRGTYLMRTGHQPMGPIRYPSIGATLSKELGHDTDSLPNYVAIAPFRAINQGAFGPGFLGPRFAPLSVGESSGAPVAAGGGFAELRVDDINLEVPARQFERRMAFWSSLESRFIAQHKTHAAQAHDTVYQRAVKLMNSTAAKAFDLSQESDQVREAYGKGRFGQGCLMARRLIEQGVGFVEVTLGSGLGWDTHADNFRLVKDLSAELDKGWSMLMQELDERGLLEATTILWMGEFGRTPTINPNSGRDHFPAAWTAVLAGGGIRGGQAHGKTSEGGDEVEDGKVDVPDLLATLCQALGIPPGKENISDAGRPIKIAEGKSISELVS